MDIGIYARPDYYFHYQNPVFNDLMAELNATTDPDKRTEMLKNAQTIISEDYVNGFLFQLAQTNVVNAKIEGIWENAPTQAIDLTAVYWTE
jgi:peptide/nickel transport system substrate-binding protein